jgi:NTP pyrophosphatase (non-canonical NTP hydrolase)
VLVDNYDEDFKQASLYFSLFHAQITCHDAAVKAGWWNDIKTGESLRGKRNVGEAIALMHSELSEALEAHRKDLNDDKITDRKGLEVELADCVIRILDFAGGFDLDIAGAVVDKLAYNAKREDHKPENRAKEGGKAF